MHIPVRYAWDQMHAYLQLSVLARSVLGPLIRWQLHALRKWDQLSAQRVDHHIANSPFTARRIRKYWGREASVIYPPPWSWSAFVGMPIETTSTSACAVWSLTSGWILWWKPSTVLVSRSWWLAMALRGHDWKLWPDVPVTLLGRQSQQQVEELMARCLASVYAGLEDFGIAPVEAMAAGAPVIVLGRDGLLDTVRCASAGLREPTGVLFPDQSVESLVQAVEWSEQERIWRSLDSESIRAWAERFRPKAFAARFESALGTAWSTH